MTGEPLFLSTQRVLELHAELVAAGECVPGLPRPELLDSASQQPSATAGGDYLHATLPAMAAAYAFHLCQNHPFVDGNKRVAALAAIVFLRLNGIAFSPTVASYYNAIISVAEGRWSKADLTAWFESQCSD